MSVPKVQGDIKAPKVEIEGPEIEGPEGGFKMPKSICHHSEMKGPKLEGPDVDVKIPKADIDLMHQSLTLKDLRGKSRAPNSRCHQSLVQRFQCQMLISI